MPKSVTSEEHLLADDGEVRLILASTIYKANHGSDLN